jgi:VWFA-related protein
VLVDVIVTDPSGNPVNGLKKGDFVVKEQGKRQDVSYFEEHRGLSDTQAKRIQIPSMPPNSFSNYSPIATPPAVNILLLDSLNTPATDQMYLRQSAENYLKNLKPGSRLAIFTLSLRLRVVEGFSDDPALLAKALTYRENNRPEPAVLLPSLAESGAENTVIGLMNQQVGAGPGETTSAGSAVMIEAFEQFLAENHYAQTADREYRTSQALQQLAIYLSSVPGRKNLIWLTGAFPLNIFGVTDMRFDDTVRNTVNLLSAARVALYPVDVRGAWTSSAHTAENQMDQTERTPQQLIGPPMGFPPSTTDPSNINSGHDDSTVATGTMAQAVISESAANNSSNASMDMVAQQTGGRAFYNRNDLAGIVKQVVSGSSNFYTLSYTPPEGKMDGGFRKIHVDVPGGKYVLSYRRGYYASEEGRPGASQAVLDQAVADASRTGSDPLKPFMDFGLPQTDQILYTVQISPAPGTSPTPSSADDVGHYRVDFVVNLKDLDLKLDPADGLHKGMLNLSLIVYDRYGQISSRRDNVVQLEIKPNVWEVFEKSGLQLHQEVNVPVGQFWVRTGIIDDSTHKVGTLQVPFTSVHSIRASAQTN